MHYLFFGGYLFYFGFDFAFFGSGHSGTVNLGHGHGRPVGGSLLDDFRVGIGHCIHGHLGVYLHSFPVGGFHGYRVSAFIGIGGRGGPGRAAAA